MKRIWGCVDRSWYVPLCHFRPNNSIVIVEDAVFLCCDGIGSTAPAVAPARSQLQDNTRSNIPGSIQQWHTEEGRRGGGRITVGSHDGGASRRTISQALSPRTRLFHVYAKNVLVQFKDGKPTDLLSSAVVGVSGLIR
jgi:hypothetical protein